MSIAIIDYGSGNLHSAAKAFQRAVRDAGLDETIAVTSDPEAVRRADRIVLPGVGAFADCRRGLHAVPGMTEALTETVRGKGRPFFGICVGMQLMATRGLEYETSPGLDWIAGDVTAIRPDDPASRSRTWAGTRFTRNGTTRCSTDRDGPDGAPRLFRPFLCARACRHERPGGRLLLRRSGDGRRGQGEPRRHPVPSRKSQSLGLRLIANFLRWRP